MELGLALPGVDQLYVGCRSIVQTIFKEGEIDLVMRFTALESQHGAPRVLTQAGLSAIVRFAEGELTATQVRGRNGQHTSLPLTDTPKARQKHNNDEGRGEETSCKLIESTVTFRNSRACGGWLSAARSWGTGQ